MYVFMEMAINKPNLHQYLRYEFHLTLHNEFYLTFDFWNMKFRYTSHSTGEKEEM